MRQFVSHVFLCGRGHFAGQQHLAVVAGHIDMTGLTQILAETLRRAQLNALVFQLDARSAAVHRHHTGHHRAAHHQRGASRQARQQRDGCQSYPHAFLN